MRVWAVIGGHEYEGEHYDSLRLFASEEAAREYAVMVESQYDYCYCELREVE